MRKLVVASAVGVLFCCAVVIFSAATTPQSELRVTFLNVGQGDATFITTPHGRQILIDGGPDRAVLRELSEVMPWWDRSIDVVIATHPDADHVSGLVDVLQRYTVSYILESGVQHDTPQAESMLTSIANEGAQHILARRGQYLDFGDGVRLEVLFPDRNVSGVETNTASIIARVVYGDTSVLLTGDAPASIEKYLVALHGKDLSADVLKVGHHGSDTSNSLLFVGFVSPQYAVISRGCENAYGHPHQTVRDTLARFDVTVFDTCEHGRMVMISDGMQVVAQKGK